SSLDQIGPITKTVQDAQIIYGILKGKDSYDSTSRDLPMVKFDGDKKFTIGIPYSFLKEGVDPEVMKNFEESVEILKKAGHTIKDIALPNLPHSLAVYYIIMPA